LVKPEPAIYELMLERLEVEAGRAVFLDDFIENVAGARQVGMQAIHFQSSEQALGELGALLKPDG
jgi:HAD superfamily hydrolase (TIGR01509 family)